MPHTPETPRSVTMLIHGAPKAGKSTLASTSPKPTLYIDVEGGTRFLGLNSVTWDVNTSVPPVCDGTWDTAIVRPITLEEVKLVYQWLNSGQHCFESVVIDSISVLQRNYIDEITNRDQATQQDWGVILRNFAGTIRDFHNLAVHPTKPLQSVCFVCESRESNSDGRFRPFAQGQSNTVLPYIPDILGAMKKVSNTDPQTMVTTTSHILATGVDPRYETGHRVGPTLPPNLPDPTIPLILDYIYGTEEPQPLPMPNVPPTQETSTPVEEHK